MHVPSHFSLFMGRHEDAWSYLRAFEIMELLEGVWNNGDTGIVRQVWGIVCVGRIASIVRRQRKCIVK